MIEEARALRHRTRAFAGRTARGGSASAAGAAPAAPAGSMAADFMFVQVSYSVEALLRWRDANPIDVPVYAGVDGPRQPGHGPPAGGFRPRHRRSQAALADRVAADPMAGVDAACEQVLRLRDSGAFDGVHIVPVHRYWGISARLETLLSHPAPSHTRTLLNPAVDLH